MLNSLGASSMFSPARVTLRRMQSSDRSPTCSRSGRGLAAAQQNPHAGQQFDEREGLDEIIVGAAFQALHAIVHGIARAQDQHRRADLAVADLLQHGQAVHVRQAQVQDDQVVFGGVHHFDRRGARRRHIDRVSAALQAARQKVGNPFFVFDHQNPHMSLV